MFRRLSFLIPSPAMGVAVAALIAACCGLAVAASSSSPTIRACANKKTGALRLANKCRKGERAVSWSRTGPQGVAGLAGAKGATGTEGPKGPEGAQGPGATSFTSPPLPHGTVTYVTLATVGGGVNLLAACGNAGEPSLKFEATGASDVFQGSGLLSRGTEALPDEDFLAHEVSFSNANLVSFDGMLRNSTAGGKFARVLVSGGGGSQPCTFFVMVIPSS
jgi:hypothetical protein